MTTKSKESPRKNPSENVTIPKSAIPDIGSGGKVAGGEGRDIGGTPMVGQRRMLSVAQFCHCYGIGKTMAYAEMAAGRLSFVKRGKRRLIPVDAAEAWAKPAQNLRDQSSAPGAE